MEHFKIIYAGFTLEDIPNKLIKFLPKDKNDIETALKVTKASDDDLEPILPHLITWMQDLNWPVTKILAPRLNKFGKKLSPIITPIFKTNDHIWKYWILSELIDIENLSLAREVKEELLLLTKIKEEEGVSDLALKILSNI